MAITTTSALDGLLYIRNGNITARWNFPDAVGSSLSSPEGVGNSVGITYSLLTLEPSYSSVSGFLNFDAQQKTATREVLSWIEGVANVGFIETVGASQMTFGNSSQPLGQGGYAYTPSYAYSYSGSTIMAVTEQNNPGDVWINRNAAWNAHAWVPGNDGYVTLLHEIGHALGLKHPFEASANGYFLDSSLDNERNTVMSYTMAPNSTLIEVSGSSTSYSWQESFVRPSTLMPLDIEALQYLYGANTTTRTGNDVYRWETSPEILETIWDSAGDDTIDCSNQALTCVIDLHAGSDSSISLRQTDAEIRAGLGLPSWFNQPLPVGVYDGSDNIAIAKGVIIENATGGSGNDQIYGNEVGNRLAGGAGNDSLIGAAGNDILNGGAGSDSMSGGIGNDTFYIDNSGDKVSEASAAGTDTVCSYLSAYTLGANVENGRIMIPGTANLTGNALSNTLYAGKGTNTLDGGSGTDTVSYQNATAAVKVSLAVTAAQATGGSGFDKLVSIESLTGSSFNDTLTGSASSNALNGGLGADTMLGGDGSDIYYVDNIGDRVVETNATSTGGTDTVLSTISYTLGSNVENLTLSGTSAIKGTGNALANVITGNAASNTLTGGAGADKFVCNAKLGASNIDTLTDFKFSGADKVLLDDDIFLALGIIGTTTGAALTASKFQFGLRADDAGDRLIYDQSLGKLYYDADGTGASAQVQIALIGASTHAALAATDFLVIA